MNMKKIMFFFLLTVLAGACRTQEESGTHFVADAMKEYIESGKLPGAVSVLYNDGVEEIACMGYADVAAGRPVTMDDLFMQCSQTKGFCGVTVAKLIEEGKIALDDPVSKYLPEFGTLWIQESQSDSVRVLKKARNTLTIRMVMNHTGGFPFETCIKQPQVRGGGWSGGSEIRQTAVLAANSPLLFEPGTSVRYSNTGIDIGAAVVEVVTGMKWEDYLKQTVLDPLGMRSTWFWPTDRQLETMIEMYKVDGQSPAERMEEHPNQQRPYNDSHVRASAGAGLWTTVNDQLKFYKMLMNLGVGDNGVRILEEETVKSLLAVSTRPEGMDGYSLGLTAPVEDTENSWFGHGGAWCTNCFVNWHKKQLKLWVVQIGGGSGIGFWNQALWKAQDDFFACSSDKSAVEAYTGRMQ